MLEQQKVRLRRRQLGGDQRAGLWARNEARRRQWAFIKSRWPVLTAMMVVAAGLTLVAARVIESPFMNGLVVGASTVGTTAALWWLVAQASGTAQMLMGADAEQWTAAELRPLRSSGWVVINHVTLRTPDIDHVLIGPAGVFVVETKWSRDGWDLSSARLSAAQASIRESAKLVRLWDPVRSMGIDRVEPVITCWGGLDRDARPDKAVLRDGVTVLIGTTAVRDWRKAVVSRPAVLTTEDVNTLWRAFDLQVRSRDKYEGSSFHTPPSFSKLSILLASSLLAALAGFMLLGYTATVVKATPLLWACAASYVAIGLGAFRVQRLRVVAVAFIASQVGTMLWVTALLFRAG